MAAEQAPSDDAAAAVQHHAAFFDALVSMFPPHVYLEREDPVVNPAYLKKSEKAAARLAAKESSKAAKRRKLDPNAARTTLELQKERLAKGDGAATGGRDDAPARTAPALAASRDELRERLAKRLEDMRRLRKAAEQEAQANDALAWRKRARREGSSAAAAVTAKAKKVPTPDGDAPALAQAQAQAPAEEVDPGLQFNRLRVESRASEFVDKAVEKKRQRARDEKREKRKLARGDADADGDGDGDGDADAEGAEWGKALRRAAGERVLDDPKLLKKALRREEKRKEKNREKWAARVDAQDKRQRDAQDKRSRNLKSRRDDKLARKVARRDKKLAERGGASALADRPGFEGRKKLV